MYLGSPEPAVAPLRALVGAGFEVALVVSQPDRKRGRGGGLMPTPVKVAARELGLATSDRVDDALGVGAELGVVVAYGRLVRPHVLARLGLVNLHFSLLPRWRGAAPVERAILAGDDETGVCLMRLEEGLDTGPVYACERLAIGPEETASELRRRLVDAGCRLLVEHLTAGLGDPTPQEGEATYAAKIDPAELRLVWARPAADLARLVRLEQAWTTFRGRRLKVLQASVAPAGVGADLAAGALDGVVVGTGDGALELQVVQPEGKAPQAAAAWRNGARPGPDDLLGG